MQEGDQIRDLRSLLGCAGRELKSHALPGMGHAEVTTSEVRLPDRALEPVWQFLGKA